MKDMVKYIASVDDYSQEFLCRWRNAKNIHEVNMTDMKDYIVTFIAKNEPTRLLHSRCFRATDKNDARDAFDAYHGGAEPMEIISITEKNRVLTDEEIDICISILDTVKMYSFWDDNTKKYVFNGKLASLVFGATRMESLVLAIGKIANMKK